eukprot:gene19342-25207_t
MASKQYNQPTSGQHVRIGNWFEELKLKEETGYRFQPPQTDKSFGLLTKDRCITHTEQLNPRDYKSTVQSTITPPQAHDQYKWMQTKIGPREKLLAKQRKDTVDKQFEYETTKFNEESRIVDYTSDYKANFKSSTPLNNKTFEIKKLTTKVGNYITDTPITIYSDAVINDKSSFHFPATFVGSTNPFGRHSGFSADYARHTLVSKRGESFEHPYPLPTIKDDKVPERDGTKSSISDVSISPDTNRIIVAVGNRVLLYNAENGDLIESLKAHKDMVFSVHYSHDGTRFASGGADSYVVIWKANGQGLLKYDHPNAIIQKIKFCPTEIKLVSCTETDFGIWKPDQKRVLKEKMTSRVISIAWSTDGNTFALGTITGLISIRNLLAEEITRIERKHPVWCLLFVPNVPSTGKANSSDKSSDNDILISGCWQKALSFYKLQGNNYKLQSEKTLSYYPCSISYLSTTNNKSSFLIVSGSNKKACLYSREGVRLSDLIVKDSWVWSCASSTLTSLTTNSSDKVVIGCDNGDIDTLSLHFTAGQRIYCLYHGNIASIDVPQGQFIQRALDNNDHNKAYSLACLGATEDEWKLLAMKALRNNMINISKNAFGRLKDIKYLYLLEQIERYNTNHMVSIDSNRKRQQLVNASIDSLDPIWTAELLAYEGFHNDAAKAYARLNQTDESIRILIDMKRYEDAKLFARNFNKLDLINDLTVQQAHWLEEINDWKAASQLFLSLGNLTQAMKVIISNANNNKNDNINSNNIYNDAIIELVREISIDSGKEALELAVEYFLTNSLDSFSREVLIKLGDINRLMSLYIKQSMWEEAAKLAEDNDGKFNSDVFLPYAEYLLSQDKFDDAMIAYKKADRQDLSIEVLDELSSCEVIPLGISTASTIYTLAKQSMTLGCYKLARHSYERLNKLKLPNKSHFIFNDIELDMLIVQAKPVRDATEHLPVCYRCGSTNPLLNPFTSKYAKGDVCTNCGHPFVRSFINFDVLPLVEFVPEPKISDEETIELIRQQSNELSKRFNNWKESKDGDADVIRFDGNDDYDYDRNNSNDGTELFTKCLNKTIAQQKSSYLPVTVDANTLLSMKRSEVFVCRPSSQDKRATFYKNMLPEIPIAISQPCHRFFHLEDFEFAYLSNKGCPYSRLKNVGEYGSL